MTRNSFRMSLLRSVLAFVLLVTVGVLIISCSSSPSSTPGSNSSYPQLKPIYRGTYIETSQDAAANGTFYLSVDSEDQQGNVKITVYYDYSTSHCSGNVTTDGQITLHCNYIGVTGEARTSTFQGTIFPDGHIEGTDSTDNDPYHHAIKWNVS